MPESSESADLVAGVARHLFSRIAAGTGRPIALSVCHIPAAELFPALSPRAVDGLRLAADWCAGWINSQWPQAERYVGAELPASALSLAIGAYEAHEPMATSICPPLRGRLEKAAALEAEPWEDAADALWTVAE